MRSSMMPRYARNDARIMRASLMPKSETLPRLNVTVKVTIPRQPHIAKCESTAYAKCNQFPPTGEQRLVNVSHTFRECYVDVAARSTPPSVAGSRLQLRGE